MSYTVLYRKFRPKNFSEIVGQDSIVNILKNQIKNDKIAHAYLFSGIRGTGKTSTAKVLAKSICCLDNKDGEACGKCASCRNIEEGAGSDIIEIDAASNRRIDEIRDIQENIGYMPNFGRYRVFIIDEVHMLTPEASNALLKTLEEPPEHVVFIFATTEANKILPTILSRCQRFDFSRIDTETVTAHLEKILKELGYEYDRRALSLIAINTEGAMRDALGVLEKAIAVAGDGPVSEECVNEVLGLIGDEEITRLAEAILNRDVNESMESVHAFLSKGRESAAIISQLIEYYSNKIIAINSREPEKIIAKSREYIEALRRENCSIEDSRRISSIIASLAKLKNDMRFFSDTEFVMNAKIITLCLDSDASEEKKVPENKPARRSENIQTELLMDRIRSLEKEIKSLRELKNEVEELKERGNVKIETVAAEPRKQIMPVKKKKKRTSGGRRVTADRESIAEIEREFPSVVKYIQNRGDLMVSLNVEKFRLIRLDGKVLSVYYGDTSNMMDFYRSNNGDRLLKEALKARLKKNFEIEYYGRDDEVIFDSSARLPKKPVKPKKDQKSTEEQERDAYFESLNEPVYPDGKEAEFNLPPEDESYEYTPETEQSEVKQEEKSSIDESIMAIFNAKEE